MTADEADGWLSVAVGEVLGYPRGLLADACGHARRTCTHHSQVVPAITEYADQRIEHAARIAEFARPVTPALPPPPLDDETFAQIVAERGLALSAHIDRGLIVSNGDGTFRKGGQ